MSFFFLLFSCQTKKPEHLLVKESNKIFLFFDHPPINNKYTFKSGISTGNGGIHEISYIDDYGISRYEPLKYNGYDTIIIESEREKIEISHAYMGIDKLNYIFQNGDSVLFKYDSLKPWATILNRKENEYALNYDLKMRGFVYNHDFPDANKFFSPFFFYEFDLKPRKLLEEVSRVQNLAKEGAEISFEKEHFFIDSLSRLGHIDSQYAEYLKIKSMIKMKIIHLQLKIGIATRVPLKEELSQNDFKILDNSFLFEDNEKVDGYVQNDQLNIIHLDCYNELLEWLLHSYYSRKVGRIESSKFIDGVQTSGSSLPDYQVLYDTINQSKLIPEKAKDLLLMKNMELLIKQASVDEISEYFEKFKSGIEDSALIDYLTINYKLGQLSNTNDGNSENGQLELVNSDMSLVTLSGDEVRFDEILRTCNSKMIYVDLWASTCRPCFEEIPYINKIRNLYEKKDLAILKISLDTDFEKWQKSVSKLGTESDDGNYMISNRFVSRHFEDLKVDYIPRYLLYDEKRVLVQKYAPRPSDEKLIVLLNKYLTTKNQ